MGGDLKYVCKIIELGVTIFKDNKCQNSSKLTPSDYKIENSAHMLNRFPLRATSQHPTSVTFKNLYQSTFTIRTSGHCVGTFRAVEFIYL